MRRLPLALAAALLPIAASAEGEGHRLLRRPVLDARGFEAMTLGRTMDTHDLQAGLYGIESFLPGRKVIWRDSRGCMRGHWEPKGELICFTYEEKTTGPVCWRYSAEGENILGLFEGDPETVPVLLTPSKEPLGCELAVGV